MAVSRRDFLRVGATAGAAWAVGCGTDGAQGDPDGGGADVFSPPDAAAPQCPDPFAGGQKLGEVDFQDVDGVLFDQAFNVGWDGRLVTDLRRLDPGSLVIPNDRYYIRTRYPDQLDRSAPWMISVDGLVDTPMQLTLADLDPLIHTQGVHVMECSGNGGSGFGLMSAGEWAGAPIRDVLDMISIQPAATRVLLSGFDDHSVPSAGGHSTPGAAWIFTFDELERAGAFLATHMNGEVLPDDHGFPVRLYVPGWYGCTCIKWLNEIVLVDDDALATSQMIEFAWRTHQNGEPALARDYIPASMDQAAMPVRIEEWNVGGETVYRVIGIMWGGYELTDRLDVRFGNNPWERVQVCPAQETNATWTLWTHSWRPPAPGLYDILCRIDDPAIPTRRLDTAWYRRFVDIQSV